MAEHPAAPTRPPTALGGGVPLVWKLPLLVCALVAGSLIVVLALTYLTLRWREEETVRDRLAYAADYLANQAGTGVATYATIMRSVAGTAAVRQLLRPTAGASADAAVAAPVVVGLTPAPGDTLRTAEARQALRRLVRGDSTAPVELWDARGRVVLAVGPPPAERHAPTVAAVAAATGDSAGGIYYGPFQADAGGRTHFWLATPVRDRGRTIGYVATPRRVNAPAQASATLGGLLNDSVTLALRNLDDSHWLSATDELGIAPERRDSADNGLTYTRPGLGARFAAEAAIEGTPWGVVVESPEGWATERPKRTLRILALLGLVVTAVGAAVAWVAGRRLARPLVTLTAAAESVARGAYDRPVTGAGDDEVGRLATSFDTMARQVTGAQHELERRAAEAQAARTEAERARAEAEHANRAKSDFLAVMSHELRTPLNAITGYSQLVELGVHGPVTEAQRDALARIGRSGAHLLTLINDVLSFARVDAGQVRYAITDVPLAEVLGEVEALVLPQARAAGVALVHLPDGDVPRAQADHDKLRQVLLNLLGNAVKYTPAGGVVTVSVETGRDVVRVHVRDTGTGIPAERLPHVFEPFVQGARALNRPEEGVGLGLAIARDFARGMGGDVTAVSTPGAGSTFTVTLPVGTGIRDPGSGIRETATA